ncbi:electron transfer flavoprotein subunit beta/FixA family protein [Egibacter rhizosphaerae]|uniref:Electron transfer flavoprotein subunit beta n=1 Tax=Egibacter rhizosphaerae TaxID=1670831 RepID=A0A411YCS9_9ACTN|nr:electron transfer flavoprotein subunit beta/FixA family protein [Egibacter rhizosphaerae]QBI19053.1 electron transfer flavoprotein subunit beta/FixA family protein [Egibacter rhizosphaerae]
MRIICPVKRVPDTAADKKIDESTWTVDRDASEPVLNANDEWAIEEAMRIKERTDDTEVVALNMGPDSAQQIIRKALSYGLDGALQVTDEQIEGSDALATARVLAKALEGESFDLVLMGNQSSDARTTLVPAMLAEFLGLPALTFAKYLEVDGDQVLAHRETASGHVAVKATAPAVVSVVEAINEPRYPSFKGIMAAKKKPLEQRDLATLGLDASEVGQQGASTKVVDISPKPPKEAGQKVEDDGSGQVGAQSLVEWLAEQKLV